VIGPGSYALHALALAVLVLSLGASAVRLRRLLMPAWTGAPARLVESVVAIALLVWLSELLGLFGLLYAWALVASSLILAGAIAWWAGPGAIGDRAAAPPAGGAGVGWVRRARRLWSAGLRSSLRTVPVAEQRGGPPRPPHPGDGTRGRDARSPAR
jgi:hypothetical protein